MNLSAFAFNPSIESIFNIQNLLTLNFGTSKNPNILQQTEENIVNSYTEVKDLLDKIQFHDGPKTNDEYLRIRTELQTKAQSEMRRTANTVSRISGAYGSHIGQATMPIKEQCDREVRLLSVAYETNKSKVDYILKTANNVYEAWKLMLHDGLDKHVFNQENYEYLITRLENIHSGSIEYINTVIK